MRQILFIKSTVPVSRVNRFITCDFILALAARIRNSSPAAFWLFHCNIIKLASIQGIGAPSPAAEDAEELRLAFDSRPNYMLIKS
jgi:hypothetical protein